MVSHPNVLIDDFSKHQHDKIAFHNPRIHTDVLLDESIDADRRLSQLGSVCRKAYCN
jgi:hypothetical protein